MLKSSARNQFVGVVSEILIGAVNAEVHVKLKGGETIVAAITKESVTSLAIEIGMEIVALVKTSHIILVTDFGGYRFSARNQLQGDVVEMKRDEAEIKIELTSGEQVISSVSPTSFETLKLCKGQRVTALFKAGAVILAVPHS